jgi:hypothetical protein
VGAHLYRVPALLLMCLASTGPLFLPFLISSHLISSHLISSHLISSHLISSHLISSHLTQIHSMNIKFPKSKTTRFKVPNHNLHASHINTSPNHNLYASENNRVNWIYAIIIFMFLKNAITIQLTMPVPLQFHTCLKNAIMYA